MDLANKDKLNTYIPEPDFPLQDKVEQRLPIANLMANIMISRQQNKRAMYVVDSLKMAVKTPGERLMLLVMATSVYNSFKNFKARNQVHLLYGVIMEGLLPTVPEGKLDQKQQKKLQGVVAWLHSNQP